MIVGRRQIAGCILVVGRWQVAGIDYYVKLRLLLIWDNLWVDLCVKTENELEAFVYF